jgi:hypothetical protein
MIVVMIVLVVIVIRVGRSVSLRLCVSRGWNTATARQWRQDNARFPPRAAPPSIPPPLPLSAAPPVSRRPPLTPGLGHGSAGSHGDLRQRRVPRAV